jgi:hypothetical protein
VERRRLVRNGLILTAQVALLACSVQPASTVDVNHLPHGQNGAENGSSDLGLPPRTPPSTNDISRMIENSHFYDHSPNQEALFANRVTLEVARATELTMVADFVVNGTVNGGAIQESLAVPFEGTRVNLAVMGEPNDTLIVTDGDLFTQRALEESLRADSQNMVSITSWEITGLTVGIDKVPLGVVASSVYPDKTNRTGSALGIFLVNGDAISAEASNRIGKGSISVDQMSFVEEAVGNNIFATCKPEVIQDGIVQRTVYSAGAQKMGSENGFGIVGPFTTNKGCEGGGVFAEGADGRARLSGVIVGYDSDKTYTLDLTALGAEAFDKEIERLEEQVSSQ